MLPKNIAYIIFSCSLLIEKFAEWKNFIFLF